MNTQNSPRSPEGHPAIKGGSDPANDAMVAEAGFAPNVLDFWLTRLDIAAKQMRLLVPTDEQLADAVGKLREIEVKLADARHAWERMTVEMAPIPDARDKRVDPYERSGTPVARGQHYELVPQFKTKRSYNTPAILVAVASKIEGGPTDALMAAIDSGAVRLTWQWTKLKAFLRLYGVTMSISAEPVTDHDGTDQPLVGETRVEAGVKRVAIKEGDTT